MYVPVVGMYVLLPRQGAFNSTASRRAVARAAASVDKPIVVASRSHAGEHLAAFLARLGPHDTVNMGSSLKFCLVAEGAADVYPRLGPTMEWDTAAAQCIVEEAGGVVLDRDGQALTYNKRDLHNPWFVVSGPGAGDWLKHLPPDV